MKLMKVDVPVVTDETCRIEYPFMIADSMLCAGEHGKVYSAAPVTYYLCQARTAARETPAAPWSATTLTAPTTSEVSSYSPTLL